LLCIEWAGWGIKSQNLSIFSLVGDWPKGAKVKEQHRAISEDIELLVILFNKNNANNVHMFTASKKPTHKPNTCLASPHILSYQEFSVIPLIYINIIMYALKSQLLEGIQLSSFLGHERIDNTHELKCHEIPEPT
ncbi:hypothetical protein ACJX0J_012242, partial [Zea mays]